MKTIRFLLFLFTLIPALAQNLTVGVNTNGVLLGTNFFRSNSALLGESAVLRTNGFSIGVLGAQGITATYLQTPAVYATNIYPGALTSPGAIIGASLAGTYVQTPTLYSTNIHVGTITATGNLDALDIDGRDITAQDITATGLITADSFEITEEPEVPGDLRLMNVGWGKKNFGLLVVEDITDLLLAPVGTEGRVAYLTVDGQLWGWCPQVSTADNYPTPGTIRRPTAFPSDATPGRWIRLPMDYGTTTGTGNVVRATSPQIASPAITGTTTVNALTVTNLATAGAVQTPAVYATNVYSGSVTTTGNVAATGTVTGSNLLNSNTGDAVTDDILAYAALGSTMKARVIGGGPNAATTATTLTSGQLRLQAIWLPRPDTLTGIGYVQGAQGSYTSNNINGLALYTYSGGTLTKVAETLDNGNLWKGGAGVAVKTALSSTYSASVGLYFVGCLYSSSAETTAPTVRSLSAAAGINHMSLDLSNSAKISGTTNSQTSFPSSLHIGTLTSSSSQPFFWVY